MKTVIIDRDHMRFLAVAGDMNRATHIAWNDYPDVAVTILPLDKKHHFSIFSRLEIILLYKNATGEQSNLWDYGETLQKCYELADAIPVDQRPLYELERIGKHLPVKEVKPIHRPVIHRASESPESPSNSLVTSDLAPSSGRSPSPAQARPSPKGSTGKVWEIADQCYTRWKEANGREIKVLRMAIIDECVSQGIHPATAATQYSKWKATKSF